MKPNEYKRKLELAPEALPAFLRELADEFETAPSNYDIARSGDGSNLLDSYQKINLKFERKADRVKVKLRVKKPETFSRPEMVASPTAPATRHEADPGAVTPVPEEEKPNYKTLKKRMKQTFKEIKASLEQLRLPEEEILRQFVSDAGLIVTYPGTGNPHYARFSQAVVELKAAFEHKDYASFKYLVGSIADLRDECHKAYK